MINLSIHLSENSPIEKQDVRARISFDGQEILIEMVETSDYSSQLVMVFMSPRLASKMIQEVTEALAKIVGIEPKPLPVETVTEDDVPF